MKHEEYPVRAGVFEGFEAADKAVEALLAAGFDKGHVAVVCSDRADRRHMPDVEKPKPSGETTAVHALEGTAIGALVGGATTLAVATTGGLILIGMGAWLALIGASVGTFVGAMASRGVEPEIADYYDQALEKGMILVAVTGGDHEKAERILREAGAAPIELPKG